MFSMVQLLLLLKSLTVLHANFTEFLELVCTTRSFRSFEFTRLKETFLVDGTRKIALNNFAKLVFRWKSISNIYYHQSVGRWVDVLSWRIVETCQLVSFYTIAWRIYAFWTLQCKFHQTIFESHLLQITRFLQTVINYVSNVSTVRYGWNNITSYIK